MLTADILAQIKHCKQNIQYLQSTPFIADTLVTAS